MRILKVTLLLSLLSFIYWSMGDTFFNWLFPFSSKGKGPWITVEGVAPKYTKPYVSAVYKSKDCLEYEFSATMTPHKVPTYNGLSLDETKMPKITITKGKEWVEYPNGRIDLNRQSIDYWKITSPKSTAK
nr:hypothetical protein [Photorhabdus australis]